MNHEKNHEDQITPLMLIAPSVQFGDENIGGKEKSNTERLYVFTCSMDENYVYFECRKENLKVLDGGAWVA